MLNTILLISSLLGATATSTNGQPVSLSITFSAEVISTMTADINMYQLDSRVAGIYKIETKYQTSGMENAKIVEQNFLVVDNFGALNFERPTVVFNDNGAVVNVPETVVAVVWPKNMNDREVVAFYKKVRKIRGTAIANKRK